MRILVWNSLVPSQGNFKFFNNAFEKTLLKEANILADSGDIVDVVFTESTKHLINVIKSKNINPIFIENKEILDFLGSFASTDESLYLDDTETIQRYINLLDTKLATNYDAILVWETPVPFLKKKYAEALIINQMPGFFCKAPYPYLINFDLDGLYKKGGVYNHADDIINYEQKSDISKAFKDIATQVFIKLNPFKIIIDNLRDKYLTISLLPLQISSHYNFKCDSIYRSQQEFLIDTLNKSQVSEGVIVTQYISRFSRELAINDENYSEFKRVHPNLIFDDLFDKVSGVSQYFVPFVDKIYSFSSSIVIQGLLFSKDISIEGSSFLSEIISRYNKNKSCQLNIIGFLLERSQILASKIFERDFLHNYIIKAIELKNSQSYVERYPYLSSLSYQYNGKLLAEFDDSKVQNELKKLNLINDRSLTDLEKFKTKIEDPSIKVISFDVFDTLITRPLVKPADLYLLLQQYCFKITHGKIDNFATIRSIAETNSRLLTDSGETTLSLIYDYIQKTLTLSSDLLEQIKKHELYLEYKLSKRQNFGYSLYQIAKQSGKKIVFISDMYLDVEFIKSLLEKHQYTVSDNLYVSRDFGCSKKEGGLFEKVIGILKIDKSQMIHIGDNKVNDFEMPRSKGIQTFRVNNPTQAMNRANGWKSLIKIKNNIASSFYLGSVAGDLYASPLNKDLENSMFLGSDFNFGKYVLGPMVFSYVKWIIEDINRSDKKPDIILFLAREGKYCKNVYDILCKDKQLPRSIYLYASRRCLNIANLTGIEDIISIAGAPYADKSNLRDLISDRFGISISDDNPSINRTLSLTPEDKQLLINTALSFKEEIIIEAKKERAAYTKYLANLGLFDKDINIAIVDLGWKCRMQIRLGNILNKGLTGYYYSTINESEYAELLGHTLKIYTNEQAGKSNKDFIVNNRHLMETLLCCSDETLICINEINGECIPEFSTKSVDKNRSITCSHFESGINEFSKNFKELTSFCPDSNVKFSRDFIDSIIKISCSSDNLQDNNILRQLSFVDFIGGIVASKKLVAEKSVPAISCTVATLKNSNKKGFLLTMEKDNKHALEKFIFSKILSERLYKKYLKNRHQYFIDSKIPALRAYYSLNK